MYGWGGVGAEQGGGAHAVKTGKGRFKGNGSLTCTWAFLIVCGEEQRKNGRGCCDESSEKSLQRGHLAQEENRDSRQRARSREEAAGDACSMREP